MQCSPFCDTLFAVRARRPWQWDEFKETAARRLPDRLYVTLSPGKGEFVINLKTYQRMNEPEAVVLLFDRDSQTIGVRPSRLDVLHSIVVHKPKDRTSLVFRSKRFLEKHRIFLERVVQFPTAELDEEGVLILNLREMVAATHMSKRKN